MKASKSISDPGPVARLHGDRFTVARGSFHSKATVILDDLGCPIYKTIVLKGFSCPIYTTTVVSILFWTEFTKPALV